MALVTLLTDFGLADTYVSEMKGVLLTSNPSLAIVDITHMVPQYGIEIAAFQLMRSFSYFPPNTIHIAIVDPGVGTPRKNLCIVTPRGIFVGPDNGVLLWSVERAEIDSQSTAKVFEIPVSPGTYPTFYGRDVFAPFVARLLGGSEYLNSFTQVLRTDLIGKSFPKYEKNPDYAKGEIVHIDTFGNCITNIPAHLNDRTFTLKVRHHALHFCESYHAISDEMCGIVTGSHGFWEIAAKKDSASRLLNLQMGEQIYLFPAP